MDTGKKVASSIPEAGVDRKTNQIFIRNLSYDVTSDDLLKIFEYLFGILLIGVLMKGQNFVNSLNNYHRIKTP